MAKSLPSRPNLEHLRSQAKHLLVALNKGDTAAAQTFIEHLPAARGMTPARVRAAEFRLADAQSAIARQSGFENWPNLARHVDNLRRLEGEWSFVTLEVDGRTMPAGMLAQSRILIDGDRFRTESAEAIYDGVFGINVEAEPPTIDIEFIEGPEAGNWSYGIYELRDDALRLCLGLTGAPRPSGFTTTAGSGHALEHLRRASTSRPSGVTGGTRASHTASVAATPVVVDESRFAQHMTPLLERLQGEWTPVELVTDGKPLAAEYLPYGSRTMTGNETRVVFGGQTMVHARVALDESVTPVAVDYLSIPASSRSTATLTRGIVEWTGDELSFCMAAAGDERPTDFRCAAGSGCVLSRWKRK